jgi:hypothetical protein
VRQRAGVLLGPDADGDVDPLVLEQVDRRAELELIFGGEFVERFLDLFGGHADEGVAAGAEDFFVQHEDEGRGDGRGADADELVLLHAGGVVHQHVGESGEAGIAHGGEF